MFFKLAVVGLTLRGGLGIAHQCLACYHARATTDEPACAGFGSGCLGFRPIRLDASSAPGAPAIRRAA